MRGREWIVSERGEEQGERYKILVELFINIGVPCTNEKFNYKKL